ncbi:unnamed protein product [Calypogeia fissa]
MQRSPVFGKKVCYNISRPGRIHQNKRDPPTSELEVLIRNLSGRKLSDGILDRLPVAQSGVKATNCLAFKMEKLFIQFLDCSAMCSWNSLALLISPSSFRSETSENRAHHDLASANITKLWEK